MVISGNINSLKKAVGDNPKLARAADAISLGHNKAQLSRAIF